MAQSYAPDLLENRSVEFLLQLRTGLTMVVTGILCSVGLMLILVAIGIVIDLASQPSGVAPAWDGSAQLVGQFLGLGFSVLVLLGWWKVTTPDPSRTGVGLDVRPRQVIRIAVVLQVTGESVGLIASALLSLSPESRMALEIGAITVSLIGGIAWIVQFFAAMLYLQWLARRVPDTKLYNDAKRFMWLGPLLYVVGCFLLGLGPIVALVLYLIMLFTLRKHLTLILCRLGAA